MDDECRAGTSSGCGPGPLAKAGWEVPGWPLLLGPPHSLRLEDQVGGSEAGARGVQTALKCARQENICSRTRDTPSVWKGLVPEALPAPCFGAIHTP